MIEFDLKKHRPKIVYDVNGTKKYLCKVRKMLIKITPEEKVRQTFLSYLVSEVKVPRSHILVEEPVLNHQEENDLKHRGRVDILILDHNEVPFIVYECKKETENFTDNVYNQIMDYFDAIKTIDYIGIVIGNQLDFHSYDLESTKPKKISYAEHPHYLNLCSADMEVLVHEDEVDIYDRPNSTEPIDKDLIQNFYDFGIIGDGTDRKLIPFLINLYGWLLDEDDVFENKEQIDDLGIKFTKFGNAGGGYFTQQYRAFLLNQYIDKPIVFIGLTSMDSVKNSPIGTSLFVAIETNEHSHSSLQLRCDKYVNIVDKVANIWHDATITVGKLGASKKQDLLDFISSKENNILFENKIILGKIDFSQEIKSQQKQTKELIKNLIEYALLRDEFRKHKKGIS